MRMSDGALYLLICGFVENALGCLYLSYLWKNNKFKIDSYQSIDQYLPNTDQDTETEKSHQQYMWAGGFGSHWPNNDMVQKVRAFQQKMIEAWHDVWVWVS